jgi:hypothetical protein
MNEGTIFTHKGSKRRLLMDIIIEEHGNIE